LSLAEEIRRRVGRTFEQDAIDNQTWNLATKVAWLAEQLQRDKGFSWHSHIKAFEVLSEAIKAALDRAKPSEASGLSAASDLIWGDDDPQTLGRSLERHYERFSSLSNETDRQLKQIYGREKP
jgi:hypothetical protein